MLSQINHCRCSWRSYSTGLPKFRNFNLRDNPDYPRTSAWYAAMGARPAYKKVQSDDQTLQLLFGRLIGVTDDRVAAAADGAGGGAAAARQEVADALSADYKAVLDGICEKSGLFRCVRATLPPKA
jgi:hypothetical protein